MLASALKQKGVAVSLFEQRKRYGSEFDVGLGLWDRSIKALEGSMKVSMNDLESTSGARYIRESGYKCGDGRWIAQPSSPLDAGKLLFMMESELLCLLRERCSVPIQMRKELVSIEEEKCHVKAIFSDGSTDEGDFLIGADGLHSTTRRLLHPYQKPLYSRGYQVYRGIYPKQVTEYAFQTWAAGLRFASVPLEGSQAWYATISHSLLSPRTHLDGFTLKHLFSDFHEPVQKLIGESSFRVQNAEAVHLKYMKEFSTSRCSLIGDAAHGLDPILAVGAGLSIEDAASLANVLTDESVPLSSRLLEYEKRQFSRAQVLHYVSNVSQSVGMVESRITVKLRDLFLLYTPSALSSIVFDKMLALSQRDKFI